MPNGFVVYEAKDNKLIFTLSLFTTRTTVSVEKIQSRQRFLLENYGSGTIAGCPFEKVNSES